MHDAYPRFIHDTLRIISVNQAGIELFRGDEIGMVDADLMDFLPEEEDRRWLVKLRLEQMRRNREMPPFVHVFRRCDGTLFHAAVVTDRLGQGQFETTVVYLAEKR